MKYLKMIKPDSFVSEYQHETFRPQEAEALQRLRKVASLVKPIMKQRGWKVGILAEFWPSERNLYGTNCNSGQIISLRLRHGNDERLFLPIEEVVDVMLHELCHIVQHNHEQPFHTLWNQLRNEFELLLRKGYTGDDAVLPGHKTRG